MRRVPRYDPVHTPRSQVFQAAGDASLDAGVVALLRDTAAAALPAASGVFGSASEVDAFGALVDAQQRDTAADRTAVTAAATTAGATAFLLAVQGTTPRTGTKFVTFARDRVIVAAAPIVDGVRDDTRGVAVSFVCSREKDAAQHVGVMSLTYTASRTLVIACFDVGDANRTELHLQLAQLGHYVRALTHEEYAHASECFAAHRAAAAAHQDGRRDAANARRGAAAMPSTRVLRARTPAGVMAVVEHAPAAPVGQRKVSTVVRLRLTRLQRPASAPRTRPAAALRARTTASTARASRAAEDDDEVPPEVVAEARRAGDHSERRAPVRSLLPANIDGGRVCAPASAMGDAAAQLGLIGVQLLQEAGRAPLQNQRYAFAAASDMLRQIAGGSGSAPAPTHE